MDHYPDPYDDETERRSRAFSAWAFKWLAVAAVLLLLGIIGLNLRGY
jgi:hypothetical protein